MEKQDIQEIKKIVEQVAKVQTDDLAAIVAKGFDSLENRMDTLEQGQEDIKLKLDNVAYRFELVALQKRVEELEKRAGIQASQ